MTHNPDHHIEVDGQLHYVPLTYTVPVFQPGLNIVIEGPDGGGKSTICKLLYEKLQERGINALLTRHPGATALGKHIRKLTKYTDQIDPEIKMDTLEEQLLMLTDGSAFVSQILRPALSTYTTVISDRCNLTTGYAYSVAGGLDTTSLEMMYTLVNYPRINYLFILDLPYEEAKRRLDNRNEELGKDRFESKDEKFQKRIHSCYNIMDSIGFIMKNVDECHLLNALNNSEVIVQKMIEIMDRALKNGMYKTGPIWYNSDTMLLSEESFSKSSE